MGFVLTLVYITVTIISPEQFGQEFASFHPMVYLAAVTALASLPAALNDAHLRFSLQARLMLGFVIAIAFSQIANGWFGGALESARDILPVVAVFFFIVVNVNTVRRLKIITFVTVGTCLALTAEALSGYYSGFRSDMFVLVQYAEIRRLRAAGFLSDPNDFAQILLIAASLACAGWALGRVFRNSFIVLAPVAFLLWATYLTHSRGALLALGLLILITFRTKLGNVPSLVLAAVLVFGMFALDFTGGRGISASDGADRLELWSQGLQIFRTAPLFGIGFGRFADFSDNDLTAHNSFVLCLAELGLLGSTILVALFVTTLMSLNSVLSPEENVAIEIDPLVQGAFEKETVPWRYEPSDCQPHAAIETITECDVTLEVESVEQEAVALRPFAVAMRLALVAFIATSFFCRAVTQQRCT